MESMKAKYKRFEDGNARLGESVNLERRYTRLLLINKQRTEEEREDEITSRGIRHLQLMDNRSSEEYSQTSITTLFDSDEDGNTPEIVVLQGPAGIGKTMAVQKIMLDWASGNLYQDKFNYVICVSCRELNTIHGKMTIAGFISKICQLTCFQNLMKSVLRESNKILFIIDGFDELKWQLYEDTEVCDDHFEETTVEILVNSILRKKLLSEASLLITTRPFTLERLKKCVKLARYVEVMGFTGKDRKEYFYNFFAKKEQADIALDATIVNEALFTMCAVPIICWIVCTVLKLQMEKRFVGAGSKTTTYLYLLYVKGLLRYHGRDSSQSLLSCVKKLSALAKDGIWIQNILFDEDDIKGNGLTVSEIECTFLNENIFHRDISYTFYSFIHLSVQEFFAALYYVLIEDKESRDSSQGDPIEKELMDLLEASEGCDHLKLTVHFLFGLCGQETKTELEKLFGCKMSKRVKSTLSEWLRKRFSKQETISNNIDEVNYLYETQDDVFVSSVMGFLSCLKFAEIGTTDRDYKVISYCLMRSPRYDHTIQYSGCNFYRISSITLASLLIKCNRIHLSKCDLTSACCEYLSYFIISNKSLIKLDLGNNHLKDSGVKHLCDGLRHPTCTLEELRLYMCNLTSACCEDLRSAIIMNKSLIKLDLGENKLKDLGIKVLCDGLKDPNCILQELGLSDCGLTPACCEDLRSVIITNRSLINLDLCVNKLRDSGIKHLCDGLADPNCTLQEISLSECGLTSASSDDLSNVLLRNTSLTKLDLGWNQLQDSGLKCLSRGLVHPSCVLQELRLDCCGLTSASCDHLYSVIITNKSLIKLDARNNLQEKEIKQLRDGMREKNCTLQALRLYNNWRDVSIYRESFGLEPVSCPGSSDEPANN
ncbi:LOW QUALITY PROTEIN: NACHT, LRR and PYD domains-containing protein 3-like [Discoglossus pictus]